METPYRKLVQAVFRSIDAALVAPRRSCTPEATFGASSSPMVVPTMTRSTVRGPRPRRTPAPAPPQRGPARRPARARSAAHACRSGSQIHSSLVSRNVESVGVAQGRRREALPPPDDGSMDHGRAPSSR